MPDGTRRRDSGLPMVFVGGLTLDAIAAVPRYPSRDERVVADELRFAGGGPAATAAVTAARLGATDVRMIAAVGDDAAGEQLIAELAAEGVDGSGVVRVAGAATGASVIVVDLDAGTRAISTRPGPPTPEVDPDLVRTAGWVHVDHLGWPAVRNLPRSGLRLSVDVSYPVPGFDLTGVELFAPSWDGLLALRPGSADPLEAARAAGARRVVATRGGDGCIAVDTGGQRIEVSGHPIDVVSTLGAGDVFHGALLAALDRDDDLAAAMDFANRIAARSCRALDGRSAIPYADIPSQKGNS